MRFRLALVVGPALLALGIAGCAEPTAAPAIEATSTPAPLVETTEPVDRQATTTTSEPLAISSTTEPAAISTTTTTPVEPTSTPHVTSADPPPEVTLKPPGYYEMIPTNEIDDYFIFHYDIADSYTTIFSSNAEGTGWTLTALVDGTLTHYIGSGELPGEMILDDGDGDVWVRDETGDWVVDEEMFELPPFIVYPSPDYAYAAAFLAFDDLEFAGWVEGDGKLVAVYRGGSQEAAMALGVDAEQAEAYRAGAIEVWWSTDGYFPMVHVELEEGDGRVELSWRVTDVGTTVVERPD